MKTAVRRILLLSALMSPGALYALGLGEIHLNSGLNQPFDAEIELVAATDDDLGALRATLASSDTFSRYGLDRPAFLSDFTFQVAKGKGGQDILKVTSPKPVTEPFVTLLVEASWPRGRLLREYTVLLDPPIFAPTPAASEAPVATPRASSAAAPSTTIEPYAAPSSGAPASTEGRTTRAVVAAPIEPGSTYRVRPHDTLWQIASAAHPGSRSDVNRAMVAIFQNNPQAFDGNINVLRSGSVLKIPQTAEISSISASAASAEVARQYQMWKEGAASAAAGGGEASGRLRLVTPEQGTAAPSTSTSVPAVPPTEGQSAELKARVSQLEAELAEARRLLEVRNAELATLQGQAAPGTTPAPEAAAPGAAAGEQAPAAAGEAPAAEAPVDHETAAATQAPQPAEPAKAAKPEKPKKKAPPPQAEPSLVERIGEYWWALLGLLAVIGGAVLFQRMRRDRGGGRTDLEEALGHDMRTAIRTPVTPRPSRDAAILVEEKRPAEAPAAPAPAARAAEPARKPVTVEETLSGEGAASIEAGDPLAEADFHMAYGLYDQAADLVQLAIKREPRRRELKLKLLEIFFVWGNRDRFLALAREMHASRAEAPAGEWDKILIMGKQLAPEDPLFAAAPRAASGLDMELHGGTGSFDMTLGATAVALPDLDLTGAPPKAAEEAGLDFVLDEPQRGAEPSAVASTIETPRLGARQAVDDTEEVPIESLGLDTGSAQALDELDRADEAFAPRQSGRVESTIENPALRARAEDTVEEDLLSSTSLMRMSEELAAVQPADATSETAIIDLGDATGELPALDLGQATGRARPGVEDAFGEEAATMSEVGTKLDLARAYIDMGDPEGARSILDEVLHEGNASQKQEAQRLMASLP